MKYACPLAVLAVMCLPPAVSTQQQRPPVFKGGADILTLEATVRDANGRPLTDLQPSDFTVTIDGRPRMVRTARLFGEPVKAASVGTPVPRFARTADAPPGRVVIIAVDRDSLRSGSEKLVLDAAGRIVAGLSPGDAVGAVGIPTGGIEPTRDHAAAADAASRLTGTRPSTSWRYRISWDEVIGFERKDRLVTAHVAERECRRGDQFCPTELETQAREMLMMGRAQVETLRTRLMTLFSQLAGIRAPKHLVLVSGGLPFDVELLSRYEDIAQSAARARVSLSIVHVDQSRNDASDATNGSTIFGGRDLASGLANLASSTGGNFVNAVGAATGVMDRIATDIGYFYQLGVDAEPEDRSGNLRHVKVQVSRPGASVRTSARIAGEVPPKGSGELVAAALSQPVDVTEVPFAVATYTTHAANGGSVRVIVSGAMPTPDKSGAVPAEWGYVVLDGSKVVSGLRERIDSVETPWSATSSVDVPVGRYRIRAALVAADGRLSVLDLPLTAGLRAAGAVRTSDLLVGIPAANQLQPRAQLAQGDSAVAMIELSSSEPLTGTAGAIELTRGGTAQGALRQPLELRARPSDATVVVAQAALDLSALAPGTYTASAVLERDGKPFARVSRVVDIVAGGPAKTTPAAAAPAGKGRDAALDDVMQRVGQYVAGYGAQASLIVAVEKYQQRFRNAPLGHPSARDLVAEFVLCRANDQVGWVGFRDVVSVDGKPINDRADRLQALLTKPGGGMTELLEARRIADESARFNIGPTVRNFNDPTATLFFLLQDRQGHFSFTRKGMSTIDGVSAMEIAFHETGSPTYIRTLEGRDVASSGTIWVLPPDGTVVRTQLFVGGFRGPNTSASVEVTFARDNRLGVWLPAKMTERHEAPMRTSSGVRPVLVPGVVTATATYGSFKRFETSTSIK